MSWFRRKPKATPAEVARDLRDKALSVEAATLGIQPTRERHRVWGALMDTGYPEGVATLVTLADGTASLYFSGGGGVIGGGAHETIRAAVLTFLEVAEAHLAGLSPTIETPLPSVGRVRFYVRTFEGTLTGEAGEEDLGEGRHPLSPVFHAGHAVITAMREATAAQ